MAEVFPDVPVDDGVTGTDTLMSIDKAHRLATRPASREGSCSDRSGDTRRDQPANLSFVPRHDELRFLPRMLRSRRPERDEVDELRCGSDICTPQPPYRSAYQADL